MLNNRLAIPLIAGVLLSGLVAAQQVVAQQAAADPAQQAQIRRLLRLLDDDDLAVRDRAEKDLIELGPQLLDLLPTSDVGLSAEVKDRLSRVRKALETVAVESAIAASTVSLDGEMSLAKAAAEIERQTGNKLIGVEGRDATIKLTVKDAPFWTVLDQVLDQAGLDVNPYGGFGDRLTLAARPEEELPRFGRASYSGIFRFEAASAQAVRNLRNPRISGLKLLLNVAWEPRTRPISLEQPLDKITAVDENGNAIPIDGEVGELRADVQTDIPSVDLYLPFRLPDRGVKKIASLKGEMTALVPGRVETFEFEGLAMGENVEQRRAGVTVVFESARKNVDAYEVRIRVKFDEAANALESYRDWIYRNETYLIDREGKKADVAAFNTTRQEINEIGLAYIYVLDKGLENYKLVYRTPAAIIKRPFTYELKEIPLP
jgi:hypothetical protein